MDLRSGIKVDDCTFCSPSTRTRTRLHVNCCGMALCNMHFKEFSASWKKCQGCGEPLNLGDFVDREEIFRKHYKYNKK